MATFALTRALELCRQVPRDMVLCDYVGFLSGADAPAATAELVKVAARLRGRYPDLASRSIDTARSDGTNPNRV